MQPVREWHDVDRASFEAEIVPAAEPALLRGLVANWPLVRSRPDRPTLAAALSQLDSGKPVSTFVGPPEIGGRFFYTEDMAGFNFARRPIALSATLARLVEQADEPQPLAIYAGAAVTAEHVPGFAESHPMPLAGAEAAARIWIGNAVVISTHFDASRNIACVLAGRRRFTFFPPDQTGNLYVGPFDRTMAGQPTSMVDLNAPDFERYPRFAEALAQARVADLAPGDAVYIPSAWWHHVQSFEPLNVLVNYWWNAPAAGSPFEALVHALLTVRDLPPAERDAWRAFFDAFIFDAPPDSAAHLPPAGRGIMGPPSAERTRQIRAYLTSVLSR